MSTPSRLRAIAKTEPHWLAFAFGLVALLAHSAYVQPWTMDDAYIYLRYAENFALGKGIVYNEGVRVEGYTTFVWVSLLAAGRFVGFDLEIFAKILGTIFGVGSLLLVANAHVFVRELDRRDSAVSVILLGSCGVFSAWVMAGMDAPMVGFVSLSGVLLHLYVMRTPEDSRKAALVGVFCGAALVVRPECIVFVSIIALDRLVQDVRAGRATVIAFGAACVAVYAPYFLWRYSYYGYLLPNTFYAKVGGTTAQLERGVRYVSFFCWVALPLVVPALALTLFGAKQAASRARVVTLLAGVIGLHGCYVIAVGGDAMPAFRFFATNLPVLSLLAGLGVCSLASSPRRIVLAMIPLVAFSVAQSSAGRHLHDRILKADVGAIGKELGLFLEASLPPDTVIAINAAGATAFYSGFRIVDMLGLNDSTISHREVPRMGHGLAGHEKGDGAYVLSLEPDYIQFGSSRGQAKPMFLGDREIAQAPEFAESYVFERYTLPSGREVGLYRRHGSPAPGERVRAD
jgi:arabinofuranosyltransferase